MKKKWIFPVLAVVMAAVALSGCSSPEKGSVKHDENVAIFPISSYEDGLERTMGDVMPFFDNGVMNIYHLQNKSDSLHLYYHPIARLTTTDYVRYTDEGIAINYESKADSVDTALGTGSVIKDKEGDYHFFYTGHNDNWDSQGLPFCEVIRHAVSTDNQATWQKDEYFNLYGYENDFRDPYVYYDEVDELYYMLVTTRDYGKAVIKRYSSESLYAKDNEWVDCGNFFVNNKGNYNMECPSYLEYNGYYYLAFSEQGENRVTHYWYRDSRAGNFKEGEWKEGGSIDNTGFYAGRLEKGADGLYAFAWCAELSGGTTGEFDWGGNLVVHKLNQLSNGELRAVMTSQVKNEVSTKMDYRLSNDEKLSSLQFDGTAFAAKAVEKFASELIRMSFTLTVGEKSGDCGLTFGLRRPYDNRLSKGLISFDLKNNKLICYNNVSNILRYGSSLAEVGFAYQVGKKYQVDIIIEGEVLSVYLDNSVALTARLPNIEKRCCAFYSNGANVNFEEISIYE